MKMPNIGETVWIRCEEMPGPFSDEKLISFDTKNGPISGFVRKSELKEINGGWQVRGIVKHVSSDTIDVMVNGSFFTTNGLASLPLNDAVAA